MKFDIDQALDMRRSGKPWYAIADELGITMHTLRKTLRDAGYDNDGKYCSQLRARIFKPDQVAKADRLYEAGATWKEIARLMNCNANTMMNYVYRMRKNATSNS